MKRFLYLVHTNINRRSLTYDFTARKDYQKAVNAVDISNVMKAANHYKIRYMIECENAGDNKQIKLLCKSLCQVLITNSH